MHDWQRRERDMHKKSLFVSFCLLPSRGLLPRAEMQMLLGFDRHEKRIKCVETSPSITVSSLDKTRMIRLPKWIKKNKNVAQWNERTEKTLLRSWFSHLFFQSLMPIWYLNERVEWGELFFMHKKKFVADEFCVAEKCFSPYGAGWLKCVCVCV